MTGLVVNEVNVIAIVAKEKISRGIEHNKTHEVCNRVICRMQVATKGCP